MGPRKLRTSDSEASDAESLPPLRGAFSDHLSPRGSTLQSSIKPTRRASSHWGQAVGVRPREASFSLRMLRSGIKDCGEINPLFLARCRRILGHSSWPERSTPVVPGVPAGWPYGAMPVLCLLSLISRNSPKQLGMMSLELLIPTAPAATRHSGSVELLNGVALPTRNGASSENRRTLPAPPGTAENVRNDWSFFSELTKKTD